MMRRRKVRGIAPIACLGSAVACAVIASGATAAAQIGCGSNTKQTMTSFVTAFNRGELSKVDAVFAREPGFQWYSSPLPGIRVLPDAENRGSLLGYFARRHRVGDRLRLVSLRVNNIQLGLANFEFVLRRSARDFRGGTWFGLIGKGALTCYDRRFIVLSLGSAGSDR